MFGSRLNRFLDKYITDIANGSEICYPIVVQHILQSAADAGADMNAMVSLLKERSPAIGCFACIASLSTLRSLTFLRHNQFLKLKKSVYLAIDRRASNRANQAYLRARIELILENSLSMTEISQRTDENIYSNIPFYFFSQYYDVLPDHDLYPIVERNTRLWRLMMSAFDRNGGEWFVQRQFEIRKLLE